MPKKVHQISKFDKGIINAVDKKDIPEDGVANSTDLMFDIKGQARQMGSETIHAELNMSGEVTGNIKPGYGLFGFNSDFNISDNYELDSKLLAIQSTSLISIHNQTAAGAYAVVDNEIDLRDIPGSDATIPETPSPIFTYIDGQLKVSDSDFTNTVSNYPKTYSYLRKEWFSHCGGDSITSTNEHTSNYNGVSTITNNIPSHADGASLGDWTTKQSYIFPPSVNTAANDVTHQLFTITNPAHASSNVPSVAMGDGCIGLSIHVDTNASEADTGEWQSGAYFFGISFQYDSGQESQVTEFLNGFDASSMTDNTPMAFNLHAKMGDMGDFDSRLSGINLYWTGDGDGKFSDPLWIGYWHWGTNLDDLSYFESHAGDRIAPPNTTSNVGIKHSSGVYSTNGTTNFDGTADIGLIVKTIPAITFEIRNLYNNETETIAAKYKAITIVNRRAYIGGVQRYKFTPTAAVNANGNCAKQCSIVQLPQNLDRMIKSPVNQFDVFPNDNFIDVAINDGESITHLQAFNDRILQFKQSTLYVLNISGDLEYLESQHKYMGVNHGYQVIETESGVAWVNPNGCFIYKEGTPINLAQALMFGASTDSSQLGSFSSWSNFIGTTGMVGYIPSLKQLVVFQDPSSVGTGDVLIFDMRTQSWAYGADKCSDQSKSSIVMNYNNACLYISQSEVMSYFTSFRSKNANNGLDAKWIITNLNGNNLTTSLLKYTIGSRVICDEINNSSISSDWEDSATLLDRIQYNIRQVNDLNNSGHTSFQVYQSNGNIEIIRKARLIGTDDIVYNNFPLVQVGDITETTSLTVSRFEVPELEGESSYFIRMNMNMDDEPPVNLPMISNQLTIFIEVYPDRDFGIASTSLAHHSLMFYHTSLGLYHDDAGVDIWDTISDGGITAWPGWYQYQNDAAWHFEYGVRAGSIQLTNTYNEAYSHVEFSSSNATFLSSSGGDLSSFKYRYGADFNEDPKERWVFDGYQWAMGTRNRLSHLTDAGHTLSTFTDGWPYQTGTQIKDGYHHWISSDAFTQGWTDGNPSAVAIPQVAIKTPSVTFRNIKHTIDTADLDTDVIVLSMMGDKREFFQIGTEYSIQNAYFDDYSITASGTTLTYCKLSDIKHYGRAYHTAYAATSGLQENDWSEYDNLIPPHDGFHVTVLYFERVHQVDHSDANQLKTRFNSVKTYGSVTDVTFNRAAYPNDEVLGYIDTPNQVTGVAATPAIWSINPRYNGLTTLSTASITLRDHAGTSYNTSKEIAAGTEIITVSNAILTQIEADISDNGIVPSSDKWGTLAMHEYTVSEGVYVGMDAGPAEDGHSNVAGTRVRMNVDLVKNGLAEGDAVKFSYVGGTALPYTYIVKKIYPFEYYPSDTNTLVYASGITVFDIDPDLTQTSVGAAATGVYRYITGGSDYDASFPILNLVNDEATHYASTEFSNIIMTGKATSAYPHNIEMQLSQTGPINVNQFINDPGFEALDEGYSSNISLETKTFDFGSPGLKKKFYYIDITYKASDSSETTDSEVTAINPTPLLSFEVMIDDMPKILYTTLSTDNISDDLYNKEGLHSTQGFYQTKRYYIGNLSKHPIAGSKLSIHINPYNDASGSIIKGFSINDMTVTLREMKL